MSASEYFIVVLMGLASFFSLLAALGLIRFPDVYCRLHSTGKNATFGVIWSMLATFFYFLLKQDILLGKLILAIFFVALTTPVVTVTVARAAYRTGIPLDNPVSDDLKEEYEKRRHESILR